MSLFNPVVWSHGLFLRPEHFQQQDRHTHYQRQHHILGVDEYAWGLTRLAFEPTTNTPGSLVVRDVAGILPGGLVFDCSTDCPPPKPITTVPGQQNIAVFLATPKISLHDANVSPEGNTRHFRAFHSSSQDVNDTSTNEGPNSDKTKIVVASPNVKLLTTDDNSDMNDMECIQIATIQSVDDSGVACLDINFVPTSVSLMASTYPLQVVENSFTQLARIVDTLKNKVKMEDEEANSTPHQLGKHIAHPAYVLITALSAHLQSLHSVSKRRQAHPQLAFNCVSALHSHLSSMRLLNSDEYVIHSYEHMNPTACFSTLGASLRTELDTLENQVEQLETIPRQEQGSQQNDSEGEEEPTTKKSSGPSISIDL